MTLCLALMLLTGEDLPLSLVEPEPSGAPLGDSILLRARGGDWTSRQFDFEAFTVSGQQLRSGAETLLSAGVDAGFAVADRVVVFGMFEGLWSNDVHSEIAGICVGYRDWSEPGASAGVPQEAMIYAGALYGRFDITTPGFGDFDSAAGARAGMSFTWSLARALGLTFAVEYRYLKFDYADEGDLVSGDRTIGGSGIWVGLGLDLRF